MFVMERNQQFKNVLSVFKGGEEEKKTSNDIEIEREREQKYESQKMFSG